MSAPCTFFSPFSRCTLLLARACEHGIGRVSGLSKEEDSDLKRLAEMKAYFEKKISESERETDRLKSFLQAVDSVLAEKSFRRVKIPAGVEATSALEMPEAKEKQAGEVWPITTPEGVHLADLQITESEITLVPDPTIKYDVTSPPLRAFLVARVLDPMHVKDEESSKAGKLVADRILAYEVADDGGALKSLRVRNYGDQGRLTELRNAIRWTVRRMYEKTLQTR
jgi:hypothetical protein